MLRLATLFLAGALLSGCAAFNNVSNEVSTFGSWPDGRKPASYVFERLPSQQTQPKEQQMLEDAAAGALQQAGFTAATDPQAADYLMQVGARVFNQDPWSYNDPLFWRGDLYWGRGHWGGPWGPGWGGRFGFGPGWGYGWGPYDISPRFAREVALIIRDRKTGTVLYEARANNVGPTPEVDYLLPAMFEAAMKDFPAVGPNPRNVTVEITKKQG